MKVNVSLNGKDASFVNAVLFALSSWSFERPHARAFVAQSIRKKKKQVVELFDRHSSQWLQIVNSAKIFRMNVTQQDWDESRQACMSLSLPLELSKRDQELIRLAIRACIMEFTGGWDEFFMVFSGTADLFQAEFQEDYLHDLEKTVCGPEPLG